MDDKVSSRGQVGIWVIVGVVIVALFSLIFVFRGGPEISTSYESNPEGFIEQCVREGVNEVIDIILPLGGFIESGNSVLFDGKNVSYLCKHSGYFQPCINQHPLFLSEVAREIERYVSPKVDGCFIELKNEFERKENEVSIGPQSLEVSLGPDVVLADLNREMIISKDGESRRVEGFEFRIESPIYDLGSVAMDIASQEAKHCYFEYVGYMLLHPRFDIDVFTDSDSNRIYSIGDKRSGKLLNIAVRSCAIQADI